MNRQWRLASRPEGMVDESHFKWVEEPVPAIAVEGEILVRNLYLSLDPTQRGWIARDTYMPAVVLGEVMRSFATGRVVASRHPDYAVGDLVQGLFGWQDYAVVNATAAGAASKLPTTVPIPLLMSGLGLTGLTAYFGLLDIGRPVAGETVVVSGAAGATGSIAGQIAKIKGCRVIGIAGGRDKCDWLVGEAGFDGAIDYKAEDVRARLKDLCPKGLDVYFDNVGGAILEAALDRLALHARIILCGAIAGYNTPHTAPPGPSNYMNLLVRRSRMEGFLVSDYLARAGVARRELGEWIQGGRIKNQVDVQEGLENAPRTLQRLFLGLNQGKQLLKIADA